MLPCIDFSLSGMKSRGAGKARAQDGRHNLLQQRPPIGLPHSFASQSEADGANPSMGASRFRFRARRVRNLWGQPHQMENAGANSAKVLCVAVPLEQRAESFFHDFKQRDVPRCLERMGRGPSRFVSLLSGLRSELGFGIENQRHQFPKGSSAYLCADLV